MSSDGQMTGAMVVLALFALPFAGFGVFAGYEASRRAGAGDWAGAGYAAIFFLVFGGVGFCLLGALALGWRTARERLANERRHPVGHSSRRGCDPKTAHATRSPV